ncbi:hypothetical protein QCA50_009322 [Cerrena zonata]|uniref:NAD(P)-binding protein n=1 Tax=Cerrena zonata TaxID=2478898 RepID=A0AAW0G7R7_9APHY
MTVTYFITGANRGVGFQLAKQISADSNNVVFATTRSLANATALKDLNRSNLHIIEYDVASPLETMKKALVDPLERYAPNGVDIIILNAGISKKAQRSILQTTEADLQEHYAVNAIGPVKVYQSLFPYWSKKVNPETAKKIIFVSSGAGFINNFYPFPTSHYGASKAALNHITRHIAFDHTSSELDHMKNSIIVPLNPGLVATDMAKEALETFDFEALGLQPITPEESASGIIKLVNGLEQKDSDTFFNYDGTKFSWTVTYFITGANRGIGFELAKQLSADSNNIVFATTRSLANATALKDLNRSNLHIIEYDVASPLETLKKALVEPLEKHAPNGVDVINQNAGIAKDSAKTILQTTEEEMKEHYTVNTIANPESAKKYIFMSSSVDLVHNYLPSLTSHYGSSKAALNFVARHVAFDHTSSDLDHIKNSIIASFNLGLVETDLTAIFLSKFKREDLPIPVSSAQESVNSILDIVQGLKERDNDPFINYDGVRPLGSLFVYISSL